jgi:tetratricopeptide (TPR) repeat protein
MKKLALAITLIGMMVVGQPSAQEATGDPLVNFEQLLEGQPDDLRAGNDYRMAVVQVGQYDRGLAFFQRLIEANPSASNAHLNYGFAYVDKIPVAGAITQVILANHALTEFTSALELRRSWIGYYTRGNSYLYWPRIFLKTHLGIADLEEALKIQRTDKKRSYHVRTFVALGDGYWMMDELDRATATWRDGLAQFPDNEALKVRLSQQGRDLKATIDSSYDPNKRVDTSLQDLWASQ